MAGEFDFVVVGGGSGGCAVASRLIEDPATSVALLEAGGRNDNWVVTTSGALIGGDTNAPTIMIGEKATDMIRAELRA